MESLKQSDHGGCDTSYDISPELVQPVKEDPPVKV